MGGLGWQKTQGSFRQCEGTSSYTVVATAQPVHTWKPVNCMLHSGMIYATWVIDQVFETGSYYTASADHKFVVILLLQRP